MNFTNTTIELLPGQRAEIDLMALKDFYNTIADTHDVAMVGDYLHHINEQLIAEPIVTETQADNALLLAALAKLFGRVVTFV